MIDLLEFFTQDISSSDIARLMTPDLRGEFPLKFENIMLVPLRAAPGTLSHSDSQLSDIANQINGLSKADADTLWESVFLAQNVVLIGTKAGDRGHIRT